jgi:hypothetical protein
MWHTLETWGTPAPHRNQLADRPPKTAEQTLYCVILVDH